MDADSRSPSGDGEDDASPAATVLQSVVELSDDAIFSIDASDRIASWNRGAHRVYGYTREQIVGHPSADLVPPALRPVWNELLDRARAGEVVEHAELEQARGDGTTLFVAMTLAAHGHRAGAQAGLSVIARDLTEQRQAQDTLAAFQDRLKESEALAHVGGWAWDAASGSVQWSDELHTITGVDPAAFDGTLEGHLSPIHPEHRPSVRAAMDAALTAGDGLEHECMVVRPDGAVRWVSFRARPEIDWSSRVIGLRGICHDITDQRMTEDAMRAAYERERDAADELRAANQLKDEFLTIISHEMRTPLTAIIGFSGLLPTAEGDQRDDFQRRISRNAEEMRSMVERIIDFSRLQAGRVAVDPTPANVAEEVGSTAAALANLLGAHRLEIDVPGDLVALIDRQAFRHVLDNLLSNAVKFAPPDTTIELRARAEGAEAVVEVRDHGRGIAAGFEERIFERFVQTPDQPAGKRGTGVGLSIVSRYVELMNGRVWCRNEPDGGATFGFAAPLASPGHP